MFLFMLPIGVYESYKVFAVGNCDPKFGCSGTIELVLLIGAVFCLISMASLVLVKVMFKANISALPFLLATMLLGSTHRYSLEIEFLQSTLMTALFWLVLSGVVYSLSALASKNITSLSKIVSAKKTASTRRA
jgi:hypothetical protein